MDFDIKAKAEELIGKIKNDKNLSAEFSKEPVKTVEKLIGVDLPDDQINQVVSAVKAKIGADRLGDIAGKIGGIFNK